MTTQRIVSGAHYGARDWLAQRITGVVIGLYAILLLFCAWSLPEASYHHWASLFSGSFMKVATLIATLALIYHAWIGIRDFFMDYVQQTGLRLALEVATILLLIGYAGWAAVILWSV